MEFAAESNQSRTKLNTKGCCFLCLKSYDSKLINGVDEDRKSVFIGHLLRHFQIGEDLVGASLKSNEWKVDLCKACEKLISKFSVLCQQLEKIQIEMNHSMKRIHQSISESGMELSRVQTYSKRMESDPGTLSQLAFVDNLRKQLATKCLTSKFNISNVRVNMERNKTQRAPIQAIKEEINDTNSDEDNLDFPPLSTPPPSLGSTSQRKNARDGLETLTRPSASTSKRKKFLKKSSFYTRDLATDTYSCKICDKKSPWYATIKQHYETTHLLIRYKCDLCDQAHFTSLSVMKRHQRNCLQNLQKKETQEKDPSFKFLCSACGKKFPTNQQLCDHRLKIHKNADRFPCDLCDKKFTQKGNLKEHKDAVHLGKKYNCRFCDKLYSGKSSQRSHERICPQKNNIMPESDVVLAEAIF